MIDTSKLKFVASTSSIVSSDSPKQGSGTPFKIIATHDGKFHWDECLAVWFIKQLPDYIDARIMRTRDPEELEFATITVDVGDVYDSEKLCFDHHMKGFQVFFSDAYKDICLSSAGLIYVHYGRSILKQLFPRLDGPTELEFLYHYVYDNYIRVVDAVDNGVESHYNTDGSEPICRWTDPTSMSARITRIYEIAGDEGFGTAYKMAGQDFMEWIQTVVITYLPARRELVRAIEQAHKLHPSGRIIELSSPGPYQQFIHSVEHDLSLCKDGPDGDTILFLIHPDDYQAGYRIRTVSTQKGSFAFRLGLPEAWRGLRDEVLQNVSGYQGMSFVHKSGFLGGAKDRDTALAVVARIVEDFEARNF
ncbi:Hypothetical protein DHA2_10858 [Giardia duodenalis]|uniref:MYG1 protein n=1 Tax=Giardia intestinalis TaxID=5741 RepID=V6TJW6_GIAIN|nr:Hypothetical protein DHA2_10858 [Giardia intestinalis]